jgi:hypothetical protein
MLIIADSSALAHWVFYWLQSNAGLLKALRRMCKSSDYRLFATATNY